MALALRVIGQKHSATEHQLVAAVRQGDDRAFEELFSRYRSRITAYVLGMVRDHARAEDITQEVFLSALRRLRDSERPIAFKPWIYEIARNACIDEFRRTRRAAEVSLNDDEDSGRSERNLVSKQPTPDAAIENKQRLEALRGAFRGLSENHHRILVMRELEGLSYREIAERLNMSRPMVESSLFRARRRLGEEYEALSSGQRCAQVCEVVDRADPSSIRVLGVRARRQVALHLSHCDDCRRYARLAGADESLFRAPTFADKVAALLPFGWLGTRFHGTGRRLPKASAHGLIARHMSSASQLAGPLGSNPILSRVAAAVLMVAAAGGTYAGVSSSGGATPARNLAAIQPAASRSAAPHASRAGVQAPRSVAATAAALRNGGGGGQAGKVGGAAGSASAPGRGAASHARKHGGGPGSSGASGGGSGSSAASSGSSGGTSTTSTAHHRVLGGGPAKSILGPVLAPVVPHLPSLRPKSPGSGLQLPRVPNVPSVPTPPAPSSLPSANNVVNGAGTAANNLANSAGSTVKKVTSVLP